MGRQVPAQERCLLAVAELTRGQVHLLLPHSGWGTAHQHQKTPLHFPRDLLEEGIPGERQEDWLCSVGHHVLQSHPKDQELWTGRQCFHPKDHRHHCHLPAPLDSRDQDLLLFAVEGLDPDDIWINHAQQDFNNEVLNKQRYGIGCHST